MRLSRGVLALEHALGRGSHSVGLRRYRLFSQRQRNGSPNEWTDKLPDFVKRLEEALYRAADSKVGAEQMRAGLPLGRAEG